MRPTRRGLGVLAVVLLCVLRAAQYGASTLNALVAPLVVVGIASVVTVGLADKPQLRRRPIEDGFVGEARTVAFDVAVDSPMSAVLEDDVPAGLSASGDAIETTLKPGETIAYDVELETRGDLTVGPAAVTVSDVFGLVERRFTYRSTESVLVYPSVYDLRGGARHDLELLEDAVSEGNREEFDHLREYERGDSLRDVDWKSTAKRTDDELVVKEFVADDAVGSAEIVAESAADEADAMAEAAASVATYLLEMDVSVGITAPNGRCRPEVGREHHREILRLLARTRGGAVADRARERADVIVRADNGADNGAAGDGPVVVVDGTEIPFERLIGSGVRRSVTSADPNRASRGPATDRSTTDASTGVPS